MLHILKHITDILPTETIKCGFDDFQFPQYSVTWAAVILGYLNAALSIGKFGKIVRKGLEKGVKHIYQLLNSDEKAVIETSDRQKAQDAE